MSVTIQWGNEAQRVIFIELHAGWQLHELDLAIKTAHCMKDQYPEQGDLILDMRHSGIHRLGAISNYQQWLNCKGQRFAHVVLVGSPQLTVELLQLVSTVSSKYHHTPRIVPISSLDDVDTVLNKQGSLIELQQNV